MLLHILVTWQIILYLPSCLNAEMHFFENHKRLGPNLEKARTPSSNMGDSDMPVWCV